MLHTDEVIGNGGKENIDGDRKKKEGGEMGRETEEMVDRKEVERRDREKEESK